MLFKFKWGIYIIFYPEKVVFWLKKASKSHKSGFLDISQKFTLTL